MKKRTSRGTRNLCLLIIAGVLGAASAGCSAGAQLSVLRPAVLNARQFGGTMSVTPFDGHPMAAAVVTQDLRQRVMTAEGAPVALVDGPASLVIHGSVMAYDYSETVDEERNTCTRSETDSNGNSYNVEYTCIEYTRRGQAHVSIVFNVTVGGTGQTIISSTYEDSASAVRTATDSQPSFIDGDGMLNRLRAELTEQFARVILPWRETVRVRLGRCGAARDFCDPGIQAFRASDFATAADMFQQAIAALEATENARPDHLAEAWWNLALSREYSGDWAGAVTAIGRAAQFEPSNQAFATELRNVQRMADEARRLEEQGVTGPQ